MSKQLYIPPNKTIRIEADLSHTPSEIELPRRKKEAIWLLVFAGSWSFGMPMLMFYAMTGDFTARTGLSKMIPFSIALIITMVIFYLSWVALRHYSSNDRITFHPDKIEVTERHFFTKSKWSAPYTEYSGLALREHIRPAKEGKARSYQVIEMIHPDENRIIPLFVGTVPHKNHAINLLQDYSHKLNVPIL